MSEPRILEEILEDGKHTPGPWQVSQHGQPIENRRFDLKCTIAIVRQHEDEAFDGFPICELVPFEFTLAPDEIANAHLIAAAPELLAALYAVRDQCAYDQPIGDLDAAATVELVIAAIAKAEGRSTPPGRADQTPDDPTQPTEAKS